MGIIRCDDKTSREINLEIRRLIVAGDRDIAVDNPHGRHNLAVAVLEPARITFEGSVGYYCAGMIDGAKVEVAGGAGWGLAESMLGGEILVRGNAGNGAAAAMRGGTITICGDVAARAGVSMKGGLLIIGGDCGYMGGFMAQRGTMIVCGNTGEAFADSMYEAVCYVRGNIAELGNDAKVTEVGESDAATIQDALERHLPGRFKNLRAEVRQFKKIVAGRRLWNFDKRDLDAWREAL